MGRRAVQGRNPPPALPSLLQGLRTKAGFSGGLQTACLWQACLGGVCVIQTSGQRDWHPQSPYPSVVQTCVLPLSCLPGFLGPPPSPKAMSWKSLLWGRGQEVTGWGPGQGQADKGRRLVQRGGQTPGAENEHRAQRSTGGTSPAQAGEWTALPGSRAPTHSLCHSCVLGTRPGPV